jgi:anti-sigma B factor antagonist
VIDLCVVAPFQIDSSGYARCVSGGAHSTDSNAIPSANEEAGMGDKGRVGDMGDMGNRGEPSCQLPVLAVQGELDLAVAPWLRDQLDALFVGGATSVVVDMTDTTFLDSTALGVLVGALTRCRELGGEVHLVVCEPQVLRVLRITGLHDAFTLHQSRSELLRGTEGRHHGSTDV